MSDTTPPADTRSLLIAAGLYLFGSKGFEGTSTRAIAERADTNIASIAYHFGGKAGLRLACAEAVAEHVSGLLPPLEATPLPDDPEGAIAEMHEALRAFAGVILGSSGAKDFVGFVVRELSEPGEVANLLFERLFQPRHVRYSALWALASGKEAEAEDVKLSVFALIGQVIYFRLAQPLVMRRMGWDNFGPDEADKIANTLARILDASLQRSRT